MDTWWQTETGAHMIAPLPGATPLKPGCATLPFFGVECAVLDEHGNELQVGRVLGLDQVTAGSAGWILPMRRHRSLMWDKHCNELQVGAAGVGDRSGRSCSGDCRSLK